MATSDTATKESAPRATRTNARKGSTLLTEHDIYLFKEGRHFRLYEKLGAHCTRQGKKAGVQFSVWAPNAERISVMGDFNDWNSQSHPLARREDGSGIWEGFVPDLAEGMTYKYHISSTRRRAFDKGDPFAFFWEIPPKTASRIWDLAYAWNDDAWMKTRANKNSLAAPMSIYEVHLGSWRRVPEEGNRSLTYREIAQPLADYVKAMGFTHVEFLPLSEHPFYGSWGYQTTGYFAPTARHGTPQDFMSLIDYLHQQEISVILDWVPSHFPDDAHGLRSFDGTDLYEHNDRRRGYHPDWHSYIFNYGRHEVRAFLISSALFWLDKYHVDCLRVDAVASMLYLDYGRKPGEWLPNNFGGNENLEAVSFLRQLNEAVYHDTADHQTIAEESTAWPMVSRPTYLGGLGFGLKWNMGWMHDTLQYFSLNPIHRKYHHGQLTFSLVYAFNENFVLPFSHDEVVHGKHSLLSKMPGDDWQRFANLRALLGYQFGHPGKKLLFMGTEFGQWQEWNHDSSIDWHLLDQESHQALRRWVHDLNFLYRNEPSLHERDCMSDGFAWVDCNDWEESTLSFLRYNATHDVPVLVLCNFTPVPRIDHRVGVPVAGRWSELLNSDAPLYGGSGMGNYGTVYSTPVAAHGHYHSLLLTLPPLSVLFLKPEATTSGGE